MDSFDNTPRVYEIKEDGIVTEKRYLTHAVAGGWMWSLRKENTTKTYALFLSINQDGEGLRADGEL